MALIHLCDQELRLKVRKLCTADENLEEVTVAIVVTDGFEEAELTNPRRLLRGWRGNPGPCRPRVTRSANPGLVAVTNVVSCMSREGGNC